jgi:L-iditol 2-dehydrogenase
MKALFLQEPGKVVIGDMEDITAGENELLIEPLACGICGGDIKSFKGIPAGRSYPRLIDGHELAGEVVAVGKGVTALREGDLVVWPFSTYCGQCVNCRVGRRNFCLKIPPSYGGGFAEKVVIHAGALVPQLYRIPEGMNVLEAALSEPVTCAIGGVLKAVPQPGERFVVIGLGGMGQFVGQILASAGVSVIGVDMQPPKLAKAAAYCDAVIDASRQDVVDEVMKLTGGVGADGVMEVVGIPITFRQALEVGRMGARVVVVGAYTQLVDGVNVDRIFRRDLTIVAAKGPMPLVTADGTPLAFRYIQEGIVRPKELLTALPLAQAQTAFDGQVHGEIVKG